MRTIDLTPLYRSSVGFERMANALNTMMAGGDAGTGYPPYNIEKTGDQDYRITLAVAGFAEADISIESRDGELVIAGSRPTREADDAEGVHMLHRGIAERAFERRFKLADHVIATGATLENGLLHVSLVREVPDALKPRRIAIATGEGPQAVAAE